MQCKWIFLHLNVWLCYTNGLYLLKVDIIFSSSCTKSSPSPYTFWNGFLDPVFKCANHIRCSVSQCNQHQWSFCNASEVTHVMSCTHITQEMSTKDMIHWQIVRKKNCIPWLVEVSGYHWMESVVKIILYQKPSECCSWWKIATVTCNFSCFSAYIISRAIVNLKVRHKLEAKK